jgi:hypothetical protein
MTEPIAYVPLALDHRRCPYDPYGGRQNLPGV